MLDRREAIKVILEDRRDAIVVTGLGSSTYDVASVEDHERNYYLWGAMGSAVPVGLGLAIARPDLDVVVITGDGEMLMGLGSLATVGVKSPPNLAIFVFDNGHYGETGMQHSHTGLTCSLTGVARASGIAGAIDVATRDELVTGRDLLTKRGETRFVTVKIRADEPPRVMPSRDGVEIKLRVQKAIGGLPQ